MNNNTNKQSPVVESTTVKKKDDILLDGSSENMTDSNEDKEIAASIKALNSEVVSEEDRQKHSEIIAKDQAAKQRIIEENKAEQERLAAQEQQTVTKPASSNDATNTAAEADAKDTERKQDQETQPVTDDPVISATGAAPEPPKVKVKDVKVIDGATTRVRVEDEQKAPVVPEIDTKDAQPDTVTDAKAPVTPETTTKDSKESSKDNNGSTIIQVMPPSGTTQTKTQGMKRVAILGANRIPFARSNSNYANVSNIDMLSAALNGLVERYDLQGERIGEVVAGAVLKLSRDLNLTRESTLNTTLDAHTPAYDISQACGTGLQATFAASNKIALGIIDSAIAGGVDTTSDAPLAIGDGLRKALIKLGAAKNNKQRFKALTSINPRDLIDTPQNGEPRTGLSMGEHQAITALEWNISREAQDEFTVKSHHNLARAYDEGFFDDLITPYKSLTRDNNLRPDTTLEKIAKLSPVFGRKNANPTMTAANSTPLTDGASCVLLGTDEWAQAHGLKPLAYIVHQETAAVDFVGKQGVKEGLLMAPAYAVPRMLERAGLTLQDFDFYEIHEAFASQVLSTLAAWEDETFCKERLGLDAPLGSIDRDKLNVNGSSLAAGHPFAATGGRVLATAAKLLDQKGSGRALISICAAGGQGVTCILEK